MPPVPGGAVGVPAPADIRAWIEKPEPFARLQDADEILEEIAR